MGEARKRLGLNVATNFILIFVNFAVGVWMTPYLIKHLGVAVYGIVPLTMSFIAYVQIFTGSISSAVSRYVAIFYNKKEFAESNIFFSSAVLALLILCIILLIPAIIVALFFSNIFQVPQGYEFSSSILFLLVVVSSFMSAYSSVYFVSTFIKHRFDLSNFVNMFARLVQAAILLACFSVFLPSLIHFGISYVAMMLFTLVCMFALSRILTPELKIKLSLFNWPAVKQLSSMSSWIVVNQIGSLLYMNIGMIIINVFLGPEDSGRYGAIAQLYIWVGVFGSMLTNIFGPIVYENISLNRIELLILQTKRVTKFMSLLMAVIIGVLCGFSKPILTLWLGDEFGDLGTLVWLILAPLTISLAIRPMFNIHQGMNRVKYPAVVTLVGGILNLLLSIFLVKFTELGILGVGLALCITGLLKDFIFFPFFEAIILTPRNKFIFLNSLLFGVIIFLITSLSSYCLSQVVGVSNLPYLFISMFSMLMISGLISWMVFTNKEEKCLIVSFIRKRQVGKIDE
ncbi:MAG: oligosaccharide flippase family protein [Sedimentisphaerales bacterium]